MTGPVVIAGGGLAGAAAACWLAQAGASVIVLERDAAPADKICGEFISVEAQLYLERLGIDLGQLGARPIDHVRLVRGASVVEAALPFRGMSLSRRRLDDELLCRAAASGADIRRGCAVRAVRPGETIALDVATIGEIRAKTLFLATGKHDLRGSRRQPAVTPEDLVGFKTYFKLSTVAQRALDGHVELIMFRDAYLGLQLVEGERANLCLLTKRQRLQRSGDTWGGLLQDLLQSSAHLSSRLAGALPMMGRPISIFRVPYGFVHAPSTEDPDGIFRLGDQVGVTPSFTGDGMSIALHSAAVASDAYLHDHSALTYHRRMRRDIGGQIRRADRIYRLAKSRNGQAFLMLMLGALPSALRLAAFMTRIPSSTLLNAGTMLPPSGAQSADGLAA